jgi:hypothetical protein
MKRPARKTLRPEQRLGLLAMQFRGTKDEKERTKIATEYAKVVTRLIESGKWGEIPPPEDLLPDEQMPLAFFQHWALPLPNGKLDGKGSFRS